MQEALDRGGKSPMRFGAIVSGALICLVLQLAFLFLASGVGLPLFDFVTGKAPGQTIEIASLVYGIVTVVGSFFLCGYVVSILSEQPVRELSVLYGLAAWATVEVTVSGFMGSQILSSAGRLLSQTGTMAGSAAGLDLTLNTIKKMNPRIVSDIHLKEGKVISRILVDIPKPAAPLEQTTKDINKEINKRKEQAGIRRTAETVKKKVSEGSLIAFFGLLVGALATAAGSLLGVHRLKNRSSM